MTDGKTALLRKGLGALVSKSNRSWQQALAVKAPRMHYAVCCRQIEIVHPSSLLSPGDTAAGVLIPILHLPVQEILSMCSNT